MRFVSLALLWMSASALAGTENKVEQLARKMERAVQKKDFDRASTLCHEDFLNRERLSCRDLIDILRDGGTMSFQEMVVDKPTSITTWLLNDKGSTVPVWLMVERTDKGWKFVDGGDADSSRAAAPMPTPPTPEGFPPEAMPVIEAMRSGNAAALEAVSTKAQLAATVDTCADFAHQVKAKGFVLELANAEMRERRGIATLIVVRDGKPVDQVFAYLENTDAGWRLGAVDEDRLHADAFLEGLVPALQVTGGTPVPPDMQTFTTRLGAALRDPESSDPVLATAPADWLAELRTEEVPEPVAWWFESIDRGLLCWTRESSTLTVIVDGQDYSVHQYVRNWSGCKTDWGAILAE